MSDSVERRARARRLSLMVGGGGFLAAQLASMDAAWPPSGGAVVSVAGLAVWVGALLVLFATSRAWARGNRAVAAVLDDERVRLNRGKAATIGFVVMVAACLVALGFGAVAPVGMAEAVRLILGVGVASAMWAFAALDHG